MPDYDEVDVVVVGMGPGGEAAGTRLAQAGLSVIGVEARDRGIAVRTGVAAIPSSARGWIHKVGNDGIVKLVEDTDQGVLVGATVMSPAGGEVLAALSVAVHAQVPTARLQQMIYTYPTFHRTIQYALADLH